MPKVKLTKAACDVACCTENGKPIIYWDDDLTGFGLIANEASKSFIVQRDVKGKSARIHIGRYGLFTPDMARKEARKLLLMMAQGIDPKADIKKQKTQQMTLRELMEEFLKVRNIKQRTKDGYRYYMEHYLSDWLDKPVTDITETMVQQRYFSMNNKKAVANNVRRTLSAILNYGIAAYKFHDYNPVKILADTKAIYPENRRRTYIKRHQIATWWKGVKDLECDTMRDYFWFVLLTGTRRMEAAGLEWKNVDFDDKTLNIPETKNGHPLTLPLSDFLYDMLEWRYEMHGDSEYVFPGRYGVGHLTEPKKAVYRIVKQTGVQFTVHDLRRTFLTIAESLDIPAYALKRLVNHNIAADITGSYIMMDVDRLRKPMQKITDEILKLGGAIDN